MPHSDVGQNQEENGLMTALNDFDDAIEEIVKALNMVEFHEEYGEMALAATWQAKLEEAITKRDEAIARADSSA